MKFDKHPFRGFPFVLCERTDKQTNVTKINKHISATSFASALIQGDTTDNPSSTYAISPISSKAIYKQSENVKEVHKGNSIPLAPIV